MIERENAADKLRDWRIQNKDFLDPYEATKAFQLEESLRSKNIRSPLGTRHENYPIDEDEIDNNPEGS
ncbi:MAG: hypothetical protein OXF95_08450 [Rhodobacteraceae bacterium]|nr:hypothetical protein [Paracoccaceae bacterium]